MDAREVSLLALNDCQRQGGWSDAILKKRLANNRLDSRDGALAGHSLLAGGLELQNTQNVVKLPAGHVDPPPGGGNHSAGVGVGMLLHHLGPPQLDVELPSPAVQAISCQVGGNGHSLFARGLELQNAQDLAVAQLGGELAVEAVAQIQAGTATCTPQDHTRPVLTAFGPHSGLETARSATERLKFGRRP